MARNFGRICKRIVIAAALLVTASAVVAQQKKTIFVDKIDGPDKFICERFRLLFLEELGKLKTVEIVDSKDKAQFVLEGIGRLDSKERAGIVASGSTLYGGAGSVPNALLSVKLTELATGRIAFVDNESSSGGQHGATQSAVTAVMKQMKKKMKWK